MRVLLIAPAFYDYHEQIVRELQAQGHHVTFFAERPTRWIYSPAKKLPAALKWGVFDAYLKGVLRRVRGMRFDFVLLIRGEIVRPWFIERLRGAQPDARFVMYQWDSLRVVDYRALLPLFDAAATFDSVDAQTLALPYIPLFFVPAYRPGGDDRQPTHDLVFVGSYHDARYKTMKAVQRHCEERGIRMRHYLYLSRLDYWKLRLRPGQAPSRGDVQMRKLTQRGVVDLYRDASAILDIENTKQSGLTMRTFEALATGRRLVTTNRLAPELLPGLADRIVVMDRDDLDLGPERLQTPPGWGEELEGYSLRSWMRRLLGL